ncbi:MAG: hypothetical protein ACRD1T_27200 [Acidimicrobiia bacterium]
MDYSTLALGLLALQLASFAWRITREVDMEGKGKRTWFPLSDWVNVVWLLVVVTFCIVVPINSGNFERWPVTALVVGFVLIGFHPISQAAHYRLFSPKGRSKYEQEHRDYPWITDQEIVVAFASIVAAVLAGCVTWHRLSA